LNSNSKNGRRAGAREETLTYGQDSKIIFIQDSADGSCCTGQPVGLVKRVCLTAAMRRARKDLMNFGACWSRSKSRKKGTVVPS